MKLNSKVEEVLDLLEPNFETLEKGKQRQGAVGKNKRTDYLPLIINGVLVPERERYCQHDKDYCQYNHRERFYDKQKMLFEQIFGLISTFRGKSDAQLTASVNLGAGFAPSILGLKQLVFEDKDPWLQERLSKEKISQLSPEDLEDVSAKGLMPRALEYIDYFKKALGYKALICIYPDILWGPFSLAHLIRGDDIFIDLYDDSDFVHHLMEISTSLYIKSATALKKVIGESTEECYHNGFYVSNSGVWSNEDTAVLLSPSQLEKFVFPYWRRAYRPFGGAVVHFCGRADYLLEPLLELPEIKGINLGEPHLQKLSYREIMKKLLNKGKTYYGSWPKKEGENTESYFKRMLEPLEGEKGSLILAYNLTEEEQKNPQAVMELWHSLQE